MEIKDIELNSDKYGRYSVSEALTELSAETEVEYFDTVSRHAGTGYRNQIYRIVGTDDAVVVILNNYCQYDGFYDSVRIEKDFFTSRRNYGKVCGEVSKKFALPFEVVLAVGPELAYEYKMAFDLVEKRPNRQLYHELVFCGIERRKDAIFELLGEISKELGEKIGNLGQKNCHRIANHLARKVK